MQFAPYRDLRNEPSALRKILASEGELVVTVDNKPFAVMINLDDENIQDILLMVSRSVRSFMMAGLKEHNPDLSAEALRNMLAELLLGKELAGRVLAYHAQ
ncbi:MAG: hypothetical protein Q8L64_01540 [bacterium]|jgi:hypothetical protein|nr:hypothetical protein [bacterium]